MVDGDQLSIFAKFQFSIIVEWLSILFLFSADFSMFAVSLNSRSKNDSQLCLHCLDSQNNGAVALQ